MKRISLLLILAALSLVTFNSCDFIFGTSSGQSSENSDQDKDNDDDDEDDDDDNDDDYKYITCVFCKGDGLCFACGGDGYWLDDSEKCPKCRHTGICKNCGGSGVVKVDLN